jgi:hypothetical protein
MKLINSGIASNGMMFLPSLINTLHSLNCVKCEYMEMVIIGIRVSLLVK